MVFAVSGLGLWQAVAIFAVGIREWAVLLRPSPLWKARNIP